jgi:hypothetical protein
LRPPSSAETCQLMLRPPVDPVTITNDHHSPPLIITVAIACNDEMQMISTRTPVAARPKRRRSARTEIASPATLGGRWQGQARLIKKIVNAIRPKLAAFKVPDPGARLQGARPEARAQRPLDRPEKPRYHDRGALPRLCRSVPINQFGCAPPMCWLCVAPPLAWSPTVRMREAQSAVRLHTAIEAGSPSMAYPP